jgi:hypothetical protein
VTATGPSATEIGSADMMEHQYMRDGTGALTGPTLQAAVFAGTVDTGALVTTRQITTPAPGTAIDTAQFSGPLSNYSITPDPVDPTKITVTQTGANIAGQNVSDGTDTLFNIEQLKFPNGTTPETFTIVSVPATATFTPATFGVFGTQTVNTTGTQTLTLTNTGLRPLTLSNVTLNSAAGQGFARAAAPGGGTCTRTTTQTLVPSGSAGVNSCTVILTFTPTTTGAKTGTLVFNHNGPSPTTINLTGTGGVPPGIATLQAPTTPRAFGTVNINVTSAVQNVSIRNTGTGPLTFASIAPTGTDASQFSRVAPTAGTDCGATLAPATTCVVGVRFNPTTTGAKTANITFTDNSNNVAASTQSVGLTGNAVNRITVTCGTQTGCVNSPLSMDFGNNSLLFGGAGVLRTFTVTNSAPAGGGNLVFSAAAPPTFAAAVGFTITANTCNIAPRTFAPGASCTITVRFRSATPLTAKTTTLNIPSNGTPSPTTATLRGNAGI